MSHMAFMSLLAHMPVAGEQWRRSRPPIHAAPPCPRPTQQLATTDCRVVSRLAGDMSCTSRPFKGPFQRL